MLMTSLARDADALGSIKVEVEERRATRCAHCYNLENHSSDIPRKKFRDWHIQRTGGRKCSDNGHETTACMTHTEHLNHCLKLLP